MFLPPSCFSPRFWFFNRFWPSVDATTLRRCLPLLDALLDDFAIIFERDPAASHWLEVLCCYPGLHALVAYRLAHALHERGIPFLPRFIAHLSRFFTGIDIHPGAQIGRGVFIDHGIGVVIGETAIVGDYCLIYQGVTLGGTGKETGQRHPIVGHHVVLGAGAKVLGRITIGDYARIGAGAVVLQPVPAHCTAVGIPSRNVCRCNTQTAPLEHSQLPDTEAATLRSLLDRIEALEARLRDFKQSSRQSSRQSSNHPPNHPSNHPSLLELTP